MVRKVGPLAAWAAGAGLVLGGCWGGGAEVREDATYRGPRMRLEAGGGVHVVTMRAPNPGWDVRFDRAAGAPGTTRALLTVSRPDPGLLFTQVEVDKSVATTIDASGAVEVFARVVDHGVRRSDEAYARVLLGTGAE